ncbi:MAG: hypothetical protein HY981_02820 [Candidatus Magasanikbacteria bacterium]|nr:hypothetical protein [Candidatus Magasanikbacteria bacterium]
MKQLWPNYAYCSQNGIRRQTHKGEFEGGTQFQYRTTPNKEAAERLERKEIKKFDPSSNQV